MERTSKKEAWRTLQAPKRKVRIVAPYPIRHEFKVGHEFVGKSLLQMMATRFPFRSEPEWAQRIKEGKVGVNGAECEPRYHLKDTDLVFHFNPYVIEPSVPDEVQVLEVHSEYLVVFKPAPMPMHPGGRYNRNTLTEILKEWGYEDLKIVHRLDGVTSGIVLFARTKSFANKLMECFRDGKVRKTYYAHVHGVPVEDQKVIDHPIRRKVGFVFESNPDLKKAKPACTKFTVTERKEHSAIVRCEPLTGRTHQIRLHLEQWGHPIIDDPIYGPNGDKSSQKTQNKGISLLNAGIDIPELNLSYRLPSQYELKIL